jgi:hypothetical protein
MPTVSDDHLDQDERKRILRDPGKRTVPVAMEGRTVAFDNGPAGPNRPGSVARPTGPCSTRSSRLGTSATPLLRVHGRRQSARRPIRPTLLNVPMMLLAIRAKWRIVRTSRA